MKMKYDTRLWNEDSWSSNLNYIVVDFVVDMANNKSNTIMLCVQRFFDFINMDIVNRCESRWEHRGDEGLGVVQGRCAVINEKSYANLCNIMNDLQCKGMIDRLTLYPRQHDDFPGLKHPPEASPGAKGDLMIDLTCWPPPTKDLDQTKYYILLTFGHPLSRGEWKNRFQSMLDKLVHDDLWHYYIPDDDQYYEYGACFISGDRDKFLKELGNVKAIEKKEIVPFTDLRVIDFQKGTSVNNHELYLWPVIDDREQLTGEHGYPSGAVVRVDARDKHVMTQRLLECHRKIRGLHTLLIYQSKIPLRRSFCDHFPPLGTPLGKVFLKEAYPWHVDTLKTQLGLAGKKGELAKFVKCSVVSKEGKKYTAWTFNEMEHVMSDVSTLEKRIGVWDNLSPSSRNEIYAAHEKTLPDEMTFEEYQLYNDFYKLDTYAWILLKDVHTGMSWGESLGNATKNAYIAKYSKHWSPKNRDRQVVIEGIPKGMGEKCEPWSPGSDLPSAELSALYPTRKGKNASSEDSFDDNSSAVRWLERQHQEELVKFQREEALLEDFIVDEEDEDEDDVGGDDEKPDMKQIENGKKRGIRVLLDSDDDEKPDMKQVKNRKKRKIRVLMDSDDDE